MLEQVFGVTITNSSGIVVNVRDIGEQHVLEDLGRIPPVSDYLNNMVIQKWMGGPKDRTKKVTHMSLVD